MNSNKKKIFKLKDVCIKIGSGSTPRGGSSVYLDKGSTTLIRSQNIYNNSFEYNGLVFIDDNAAEKLRSVEVKENDVLLNITGDSVARCTIVPKEVLPARVNQHVCILRANDVYLDYFFLKSFLVNSKMQDIMLSLAKSGGTRAALTKGMIENLEITLPSIEEQKAISKILSDLDEKIETNNKINKKLEEMAQAIFKQWFVDFEFPNENGEPYKSSGGEMIESELGMIPKGWEVISLDKIMDYQGGSQPPASQFKDSFEEGYIRLIQIRDYDTDNHITYIPITTKLKMCKKSDIMLARYGAALGRVMFGLEGAYNVAIAKIIPKEVNYTEYLREYLNTEYFYNSLNNKGQRSAQAGFNKSDIASFKIAFPYQCKDIIDKFNELCYKF